MDKILIYSSRITYSLNFLSPEINNEIEINFLQIYKFTDFSISSILYG